MCELLFYCRGGKGLKEEEWERHSETDRQREKETDTEEREREKQTNNQGKARDTDLGTWNYNALSDQNSWLPVHEICMSSHNQNNKAFQEKYSSYCITSLLHY